MLILGTRSTGLLMGSVVGRAPNFGVQTTQTFAMNTIGANLLIAYANSYNDSPSGFTDTAGNIWSIAVDIPASGGVVVPTQLLYVIDPLTTSVHRFWVTGRQVPLIVTAWRMSGSVAFDQGDVNVIPSFSPASSITLPTLTPAQADSLIITGAGLDTASNTLQSVDSGFTTIRNVPGSGAGSVWNLPSRLTYQIQTSPMPVGPTWTFGTSGISTAVIAIFSGV